MISMVSFAYLIILAQKICGGLRVHGNLEFIGWTDIFYTFQTISNTFHFSGPHKKLLVVLLS